MLKSEIESVLNHQLNMEQAAAQEYLAMAAWFEQHNLRGFARFMRRQSQEEAAHAMRFFDHIHDRGGRAAVGAVAAPKGGYDSPRSVFESALAREQANTRGIHTVYKLALDAGDYAAQAMLHWFISEQVEEERWATEAVAALGAAGDDPAALLMLDHEYGEKAGKE